MSGNVALPLFIISAARRNIHLAADYRLYSLAFKCIIKVNAAVHNAVVGYGYGTLVFPDGFIGNFRNFGSSVQKTVFGMQM